MSPYAGRRVFRSAPWLLGVLTAVEVLFTAGAWWLYRLQGLALPTVILAGLAVFGIVALMDTATRRVVLGSDAVHVTGLWGRRRYAKREIVGVSEEKGGPPALKLADGRWAKLPPDVGHHVANSIRAWLTTDS